MEGEAVVITAKRTQGIATPQTIDFTEGRWGHRLHLSTWCKAAPKPLTRWQKVLRFLGRSAPVETRPRCRVLCHSNVRPEILGRIIYRNGDDIVIAEILAVESFRDPADMYAITVRIIGS